MRLFERLGRLIKADAHGVMDQLEERSLLLKQHLREAEQELARKRARVEAMEEQSRCMSEEARLREREIEALDRDVELALAEGQQELARFAVRQLLPRRASLEGLRDRIAQLEPEGARLKAKLVSQETELQELRTRVRGRLAELEQAGERAPIEPRAVADEEVELELLRRRVASSADGRARA